MLKVDYAQVVEQAKKLFDEGFLYNWAYAGQFRNKWLRILEKNLEKDNSLPEDTSAVFQVANDCFGIDMVYNFDQLKIADWFRQDSISKTHMFFVPYSMPIKRDGTMVWHQMPIAYDPEAVEAAIPKDNKDIHMVSMPGNPPKLQVVYGNKDVVRRGRGWLGRKVKMYMIQADYTPVFTVTPIETCLYLFFMDLCILKENRNKVKDDEMLRKLLHVFREPNALTIRGLI